MNSFCRSIARRAFARERLPSLQFNCYCYYSTSAAKPRFRATTKTTAFKRPPPPPPSPEQPTYTLSNPSSGAKPAQSSASSSSSSSPSASSKKVKWERPSEIPFQAKVANSVQLTGYIPKPVQFQTTPDGKPWASTTITTQRPSSSSASLPLW